MNNWVPTHIMMVHNRYQQPGGEDASTEAEIALLEQAGCQVTRFETSNDRINTFSPWQKVQLLGQTVWNPIAYREVRSQLRTLHPDLMHVQNFFPLLSPAIHSAARSLGIPTVQHLRNFRLACLNAYLMRDGQVCEACLGRNPWRGLVYRCYRQSLPASLAVWAMVSGHRWRGTWQSEVDAFLTPSQFAASKLIQAGIPGDRLWVKPDAVADPLVEGVIPALPDQPRFLFIGRLNEQKGVMQLLQAWQQLQPTDWCLDLIGDGERRSHLERYIQEQQLIGVTLLGTMSLTKVLKTIQQASAIVVPSQSYETFGRVVIEGFACGRPAFVSDLGALPELVQDGVTGFKIPPYSPAAWAERLRWAGEHPNDLAAMGQRGRQQYQQQYTPQANCQQLMEIYRWVQKG